MSSFYLLGISLRAFFSYVSLYEIVLILCEWSRNL
jgi:hypothetical protein